MRLKLYGVSHPKQALVWRHDFAQGSPRSYAWPRKLFGIAAFGLGPRPESIAPRHRPPQNNQPKKARARAP